MIEVDYAPREAAGEARLRLADANQGELNERYDYRGEERELYDPGDFLADDAYDPEAESDDDLYEIEELYFIQDEEEIEQEPENPAGRYLSEAATVADFDEIVVKSEDVIRWKLEITSVQEMDLKAQTAWLEETLLISRASPTIMLLFSPQYQPSLKLTFAFIQYHWFSSFSEVGKKVQEHVKPLAESAVDAVVASLVASGHLVLSPEAEDIIKDARRIGSSFVNHRALEKYLCLPNYVAMPTGRLQRSFASVDYLPVVSAVSAIVVAGWALMHQQLVNSPAFDGPIGHPCTAEAWKRLCEIPEAQAADYVVYVKTWDDTFSISASTPETRAPHSTYLMVANFKMRKDQLKYKLMLATCHKHDQVLVRHAMIADLKALETRPLQLTLQGGVRVRVWVRLLSNDGDDPACRDAADLSAQGSNFPCRLSSIHRTGIPNAHSPEEVKANLRPSAASNLLKNQLGIASDDLTDIGCSSLFWDLTYLQHDFWFHFSLDLLHLWNLGCAKLVLVNLGQALNNIQRPLFERHLALEATRLGIPLNVGTLYPRQGTKLTGKLSGRSIHTVVTVMAGVPALMNAEYPGSTSEAVQRVIECTSQLQELLYREEDWDDDSLHRLAVLTTSWKASLIDAFPVGDKYGQYFKPNLSASTLSCSFFSFFV